MKSWQDYLDENQANPDNPIFVFLSGLDLKLNCLLVNTMDNGGDVEVIGNPEPEGEILDFIKVGHGDFADQWGCRFKMSAFWATAENMSLPHVEIKKFHHGGRDFEYSPDWQKRVDSFFARR